MEAPAADVRLSPPSAWAQARASLAGVSSARDVAISLAIGLAAWELAGRALHLSFLPPFTVVLLALRDLLARGELLRPLAASLLGLAIGYGLAATGGTLLGLLMGRYRRVDALLDAYVTGLLAAPKLIFVPILYALFGVGRGTQVAIVFINAFFIVTVNTRGGMRQVDVGQVEMARSFGATERQLLRLVLLPGALPLTMAGLRLGLVEAVKGMVTGEMFIALSGLGAMLHKYGSRFDSARVLAILLVVIAVALLGSFMVGLVERRMSRWMESEL